ncbi:unnamed protein product [Hyaloperonospora brassicae]|uniref:Uncharacterized protein n=1 Tax=Hyaloperonospora brassicae TaxID=162125 RepID=A0AAV0TKF0_HYABA|nr:unnamed protein product [Hyaloperonospora brassicae]
MPPTIHCAAAVYALFLSLSDATPLAEHVTRFLEYDMNALWPSLAIDVELKDGSRSSGRYTMSAVPVFSNNRNMVRYDVYAEFGPQSGLDAQILSYTQTNGLVGVISLSNPHESLCLQSENGPYQIPRINAIMDEIMMLKAGSHLTDGTCEGNAFRIMPNATTYNICQPEPGMQFSITGNDMILTVSYVDSASMSSTYVPSSKCPTVASPIGIRYGGLSLLTGK